MLKETLLDWGTKTVLSLVINTFGTRGVHQERCWRLGPKACVPQVFTLRYEGGSMLYVGTLDNVSALRSIIYFDFTM